MLPSWTDALILSGLPLILGIVLWLWGAEDPGNGVEHHQDPTGEPDGEEPGELAVVAEAA
jgi:hypothetical protein